MKKKPLTDKAGNVRELTRDDIKKFRKASEALPSEFGIRIAQKKEGQRGPQKTPKKESITVRFSPEVLEYFRSTGPGWQSRLDKALKEWVATHQDGQ